jgi:prepilin-type N-terminal cleavage/methylation domain-containing protein
MKNILKNNQKKAFSLTELAIVIVIISVFIAGIISAAVGASNNAKITVTKNRMNEIYKALGNYVAANGALPCPAPITDIKGSVDYGNNRTNGLGDCHDIATDTNTLYGVYRSFVQYGTLIYGAIPVQNLKLSSEMAEDAFGTKFSYVVDTRFTGFKGNGAHAFNNFGGAPEGNIININEIYGSITNTIVSDVIFTIVSHGANKKGGFNASSSVQNKRSSDSGESHNDLASDVSELDIHIDNIFVILSDKSDVFDDIVFFKTRKNIMTDFDLLSLIPCKTTGINYNDVYVDNSTTLATWPETSYGQVAVSSLACNRDATNYNGTVVYPTKKCGPFGVWQAGAIDSCQ